MSKTPADALAHFQGNGDRSIIHYMSIFYAEILAILCENDRK